MMKYKVISVATLLAACFCWSCSFDNIDEDLRPAPTNLCDPNDTTTISFQDSIFPIFEKCCFDTSNGNCHWTGSPPPSKPDYTTYAGIKAVVDNGRLQARLFDQIPSPMPPSAPQNQGPAISDCEKTMIRKWMDAGAPNN